MTQTTTGWVIGIAALGLMLGLMGNDLMTLHSWGEASTPAFWGDQFGHLAVVIAAFVGGKLTPAPGTK